ncbi:hypothetical protein EDB19DRAFT_1719154 [Suillus lakei]|nr:hypothetical protein EDB19DRAFT_1719154 [Suillus lakei]
MQQAQHIGGRSQLPGRSTDVTTQTLTWNVCPPSNTVRPFEKSARLGPAGNPQWGPDAGNHQDSWDPYAGLPSYWNHEDRDKGDPDYDENELEVLCLQSFEAVCDDDYLADKARSRRHK